MSTMSSVQFSSAVATFTEQMGGWAPSKMIDGDFTGAQGNGWSVFNFNTGSAAAADALLTLASPLPAGEYSLTFTIYQNYWNPGHLLGDFALEYTTAASPNLSSTQTPVSILNESSLNGTTFSLLSPGELLANTSNNSLGTDTFTITAVVDSTTPITGIFLDAIKNPALPGGGPGGQYPNGNFVVSEFTLDATPMSVTVSAGQIYNVSSGQTDTGDTVLGGGAMFVLSGGVADTTAVDFGGSLAIDSGGTASGTILSGSEIVLGTETGTTVGSGGVQSVYLDGTALGATVSGGGVQVVGGGGQLGSWNFNSGTANQSGSNNNLLLSGGATLATGGLYGSALSLNGAEGSYAIDSTNNPAFDFGSNDFTIQIWVNSNDFGSGRIQTLIEKFSGSSGPGWSLSIMNDNSILFGANNDAIRVQSAPLSIPNGVWQEFVVERSGSTFSLYWDGNLVATGTYSGPLSTSPNPLLIGARDAGDGRNFTVNGLIDNVAIWNRALSASEIASSWNNGLGDANNGAVGQGVYATASGTIVNSGGLQVVESAGIANNTTVSSGGTQFVYGIASGTAILAGSQVIEGGGTAISTVVSSAGGMQTVNAGATASGTTVSTSGMQLVESGGLAVSATVSGEQDVFGSAAATLVGSGGTQVLEKGAAAGATIVGSGGLLYGYFGATVSGTSLTGGAEYDYGTAVGTTISQGGAQFVELSASASVIDSGGAQFVYGTANATTVNNGGDQFVYGVARGTTLNGGTEFVYGLANATTVSSGGVQQVDGVATSTTVDNGGTQDVAAGATASSTTITSGGTEIVSAGGRAIGTTVSSGGTLDILSGGTATATNLLPGATLLVGAMSGFIVSSGVTLAVSAGTVSNTTVLSGGTRYNSARHGSSVLGPLSRRTTRKNQSSCQRCVRAAF